MSLVRLSGIGKRYKDKTAVLGADLSVDTGEVLGLVGPNGAGKSTLLKIIAGFVRPTEGAGEVLGQAIGPREHPCPFVGVMVEKPAFIEHLGARRNLQLLASVRKRIGNAEIDTALCEVGLDPSDKRPVRTYSQGMRQRLSLAQAIMEHPSLMLLDEPTNGLDPEGIVEMRGFIQTMAEGGAGVVLASHLLGEVEAVCDRVIMVLNGRCVRGFVPRAGSSEPTVLLVVSHEEHLDAVAAIEGVVLLEHVDGRTVRMTCRQSVPDLVRSLVAVGVDVEHVGRVDSSLEEAYLSEIKGCRR
ncbi:MAG: ABC transporter ATP-binding protein [Actinobacteria bacterium]|nr:ABC transporter ATP-binding protein [Actinomycetota bacterium]